MNRKFQSMIRIFLLHILCLVIHAPSLQAKEDPLVNEKKKVMEIIEKATATRYEYEKYDIDSSILLFNNALSISREIGYNNGVQYCYMGIGTCYSEFGMYDSALIWYRKSLTYTMFSNFKLQEIVRALINIGDVYLYQGNYNEAILVYLQVLATEEFGALKTRGTTDFLIRTYNNIGSALLQINEEDRALTFLNKGLVLARNIHLPVQEAFVLNNIAKVRWKQGERALAWNLAHQALELAVKNAPSRVEYMALQTMAEFNIESGKYPESIANLKLAIASKKYLNPYYRSINFYNLGIAYLSLRQYPEALHFLNKALHEAGKANAKKYMLAIHRKLAALYEARGRYDDANTHNKIAYLLNDSLLNKQKSETISLLETKYKVAEKDKEIYKKQLLISSQENNLRQKNIWIYSISGGFFLFSLMGYSYYRTFRQKQKINILKAMIEGEEKERKRIGQDLHDGIGGRIAAINMHFGAVQKRYQYLAGSNELEQIINMMEDTSEEIRRTAHNLIPDVLSKYSFSEAISLYCDQLCSEHLQVICEAEDFVPDQFGKDIELVLYRIIQELLQNIVKHAHATEAIVEIRCMNEKLNIVVEDDGSGFTTEKKTPGAGLNNIRSRVRMLQGNIMIESGKDIGTIIFITFDIHKLNLLFEHEHQNRNHG